MPLPLSLTDRMAFSSSEHNFMSAVGLPECRMTFVKLSCRTRKSTSCAPFVNRGVAESSRLVLIPLRFVNSSTYHWAADENPTSSSSGGCSRCDVVRISCSAWSANVSISLSTSEACGTLATRFAREASVIFRAVRVCPVLSCKSRAIRRRSSSWARSRRADSTRSCSSVFLRTSTSDSRVARLAVSA